MAHAAPDVLFAYRASCERRRLHYRLRFWIRGMAKLVCYLWRNDLPLGGYSGAICHQCLACRLVFSPALASAHRQALDITPLLPDWYGKRR